MFRYLAQFDPERFRLVAEALELPVSDTARVGEKVFEYYIELLRVLGIPVTLKEIGFTADDLDKLVDGTLAQQRLISLAPKDMTREEVKRLFEEALAGE